jgi:CheY-like chemotaxis protein
MDQPNFASIDFRATRQEEREVRAILVPLSAAEEIALRRIARGSLAVSDDLLARLRELALIRRIADEWTLTPLGKRRYSELPEAPLRGRAPSVIDDILDRYIPLAQAKGISKPDQIRRILVVEDSPLEADALAHLLHGCGYEVVGPVGRVREAMIMAADETLNGALLDIDLDGERSFGIASALQRRSVPVAFVSGYHPSIVPDRNGLRAVPFVAKPFEDETLVAMVKTFAP